MKEGEGVKDKEQTGHEKEEEWEREKGNKDERQGKKRERCTKGSGGKKDGGTRNKIK